MFKINVSQFMKGYDFEVCGTSYIGNPKSNTAMYISKKIESQIGNLENVRNCIVFAERGINVPEWVKSNNAVVIADNPQLSYAKFAGEFDKAARKHEAKRKLQLTEGGYYIGENVTIGEDSYIEPVFIIWHVVSIGRNARILANTVIRNAVIGDDFICNENATVGNYGFTLAKDENNNIIRMPALGKVIIGNHVEIGANNDINRGTCGDTILEDYVKLDGLVHVGHEVHICKNVEVSAGTVISGFVTLKENTYVGVNACIKNRVEIEENVLVGMGAVVTRKIKANRSIFGNPARKI